MFCYHQSWGKVITVKIVVNGRTGKFNGVTRMGPGCVGKFNSVTLLGHGSVRGRLIVSRGYVLALPYGLLMGNRK